MNIDITNIIKFTVEIILGFVSIYFIPWLRQKVQHDRLVKILDTVDLFVAAAEQIAKRDGHDGKWKKQHVIEQLRANGITIDSNISEYIEAAVHSLTQELVS